MFDEILKLKRDRMLNKNMVETINDITQIAVSGSSEGEVGLRLAAAFDLLASVEYYNSVANRGWTYCLGETPMLLYTYTNTCPRCIGNGQFKFTKANKPESAQIGMVTTELLCQMLEYLFSLKGRKIEVYKASEPIDAIVYDKDNEKLIIAEVKSAPMMTLPLATKCEKLTETVEGELVFIQHAVVDNPMVKKSDIGIYIPKMDELPEEFIQLQLDWSIEKPFYSALRQLIKEDTSFFDRYFKYWKAAFAAYSIKDKDKSLFWLTNGCGQPVPRPDDWPARRGTGYESVSDGKTSVGMDRTDDIKKAIYQVLKLGSVYKPDNESVKTAIISNIHAVRHYDEYLLTVRDIVWTVEHEENIVRANQLNPETPIYNLFDGILSFTKSEIRDAWIKDIFDFGGNEL